MTREKALQLRGLIEKAAVGLSDADALEGVELFGLWSGNGTAYAEGARVRYGGVLYRCLQTHSSQAGWSPEAAPSLWARVLIPAPEEIPEWEQPDSTNAYALGDRVRHNGKTWISDLDGNVWEPGVYGWSELG
ncbi:MAG: alpha-amylase [Oscillospiraceae bacterium]|nr:alpha-amylase [Oscillospiraceae bacterium]